LSLLPPDVEQAIFLAAFLFWLLFTFLIERFLRGGGSYGGERTKEDKGSALVIYFSTFAAIIIAFSLGGANITLLPEWSFFIGILLMFLGMLIRGWAIRTLKGYFLFTVGVREHQAVVETGPYRLVRHPAYTGAILCFVGIGLAVQSLAGLLLLLLVSTASYGYRIRVEERALLKGLGEPYAAYMSHTKRLIPFVF